MLDVRQLNVHLGERHLLNNIDLTVEPGEFVAITGRTGAGKSTLLNIVGGLHPIASSQGHVTVTDVQVAGADPATLADLRRRLVGYVFQNLNLIPTLTVAENIALPLQLAGTDTNQAMAQAETQLTAVDLIDRGGDMPVTLSGGERQRVAVARALVGDRKLLLADEPTAALDSVTAEATLKLLRTRAEAGASIVMVTHDSAQAAWAHRVLRLHDGSLL